MTVLHFDVSNTYCDDDMVDDNYDDIGDDGYVDDDEGCAYIPVFALSVESSVRPSFVSASIGEKWRHCGKGAETQVSVADVFAFMCVSCACLWLCVCLCVSMCV